MLQQVRSFRRGVLERAIQHAGSASALARACGVKTAAITNAKARGTISPELALAIDRATEGAVSASEFRPDLWTTPLHVPRQRGRSP
jgi:DNA-binding transcriptional regulator YdaS (Cro superfamily)